MTNRGFFEHVHPGDEVTRMIAGTIPMKLKVETVHEGMIFCFGGWTFDVATGAEIDADLDWGPPPQVTGSVLVAVNDEQVVTLSLRPSQGSTQA